MSDYLNTPIGTGYNSDESINTELQAVETAVKTKMDKTGSTMTGNLDMNSQKILNVPDGTVASDGVNYGQLVNRAVFSAADAKFIDTVTLAKADTSLVAGDVLIIKDRENGIFDIESGVSGANTFNIIANDAATLKFTLRINNYANIKAFGATGDGTTDDVLAIQEALDTVVDGDIVYFPPATYRIDTPLTVVGKAINIIGYGATLDFSNNSTTLAQALTISGSDSATLTTATVDIVKGSNSLTVVSESGFAADDYISVLSSTELLGSTASFTKGEIVRIASTAANTLTIHGGTKDSYDATGPTVTILKINMISRPSIKGLKIIGSGVSANRHLGIVISRALAPRVTECEFIDCSSTGADMNRCLDGIIDWCNADNCNDLTGPTGYGFVLSNLAQRCTVDNCTATRCRHFFNVAGLLPVWNWRLSNSDFADTIVGSVTPGVSTHANGIEGAYVNNTVDNAYGGFGCSGPKNDIRGNNATNITSAQIYELGQDGPWNTNITNNRGTGPFGISVPAYTAFPSTTTIDGNKIYGEATDGALISGGITCDADHSVITGNTIRDHSHGIRSRGDRSKIVNNNIYDTTNTTPTQPYGIRVLTGDKVLVEGNLVENEVSTTMTNAIFIDSGVTDAKIFRNDLNDSTGSLIVDNGTGTQIVSNIQDNIMQYMRLTTTAALVDISDVVNTTNKQRDELLLNTTTNIVVKALTNTAAAVWLDTVGATRHTPV